MSLAFLTTCQPATTELTEEQKAGIAAEVLAVLAEAEAAWETKNPDVDRVMSFFLDSPESVWAGYGRLIRGLADQYAVSRSAYAARAKADWTSADRQVTVLAPDVVCILDVGTAVFTDTAGVTTPESDYTYTYIWVHRNGEWKILLAHGS
jgi:hypothetical protein